MTGAPVSLALSIRARLVAGKAQIPAVAFLFGIRHLADDDQNRIGAAATLARRGKSHLDIGGNRVADGGQDGGAAVDGGAGLALPTDGPTAALDADVIGGLAHDVQMFQAFGQGQGVIGVLEQNQRFPDAFARHLAMLRANRWRRSRPDRWRDLSNSPI